MLSGHPILLALAPIDMRCGTDKLCAYVITTLGRNAFDGGAYLFRNRSGTRIKLLICDSQGIWLCTRRLNRGSFIWPRTGDTLFELSEAQFSWLSFGVDWQRLSTSHTNDATLL